MVALTIPASVNVHSKMYAYVLLAIWFLLSGFYIIFSLLQLSSLSFNFHLSPLSLYLFPDQSLLPASLHVSLILFFNFHLAPLLLSLFLINHSSLHLYVSLSSSSLSLPSPYSLTLFISPLSPLSHPMFL